MRELQQSLPLLSKWCLRCLAGVLAVLPLAAAYAQQKYPLKPVRLMTPFAPGGGSDILARLIGPRLHEAWGQSIIVDNRPGGGGTLGAGIAVNAAPDGYTLILVSGSYGANAALHKLPYDTVNDISPVILIGETGLVSTVHPTSTIRSFKEFLADARANPNKWSYGSAGIGGLGHLSGALLELEAKIKLLHVPYKGSGPVMAALLTNEVPTSFSSVVAAMTHIKAGRLRPIGVTPPKRMRALPDVPSISEIIPGFDVVHWYGIWGPKGMPAHVVTQWNSEVGRLIKTEAMQKWFEQEGMEPAGGPPQQFRDRIHSDSVKWKRVVKEANIPVSG
ncbi:MAG: tripartite tricarboxylate transporter substrate binding protein [Betaproteobacteria bacterium]|nr:tripartite tricarboxylate transporter substrate binding protein [Betaproteobacteria bacterium]